MYVLAQVVVIFFFSSNRPICVVAQRDQHQLQHDPHGEDSASTEDDRFILQMDLGETAKERRMAWEALHRDGYSCWLGARFFDQAVCILVGALSPDAML